MELLKAAQAGNVEEVNRLLDQGADPNETGGEGVTPLILAAIRGHANVAAALLGRGADIDRPDEGSYTALLHAIGLRNNQVTDLLLDRGADPSVGNWHAFYRAVESGRIPLVQRLLNLGADPNLQEDDELTPLLVAVGRGDLKLVKVLLGAGADPQKTAQKGLTAWIWRSSAGTRRSSALGKTRRCLGAFPPSRSQGQERQNGRQARPARRPGEHSRGGIRLYTAFLGG